MPQHYAAFISYRHAPLDSRVAAQIQRGLEHFAVPRALQRSAGRRRLGRVFRDKEELPITSDLGDTITAALEDSEFLIVICSPRTAQSQWVRREIETFLRTHSRRAVLTVLAEGEPQDIIPPILLHDDETGADLEPLSCDWRLPIARARREELPRLAAALLGCAYDELRQRQRQYRRRRLAAGFAAVLAASLGFGGYMVYANVRIRQNYEAALRSQSRYLASESLSLLEEGDRLTAALLAMEALPGPGGDRPLVAEAEYALNQALGTYETGYNSRLAALGALTPEGRPTRILADQGCWRAVVLDELNTVTVWDLATLELCCTLHPGTRVEALTLAAGSRLLVRTDETDAAPLTCYDLKDGACLWTCREAVRAVLSNDEGPVYAVCGGVWSYEQDARLLALDPADGSVLQSIPLPQRSPDGDAFYVRDDAKPRLSPDGRYVAVPLSDGFNTTRRETCWYRYDTQTGADALLPVPMDYTFLFDAAVSSDGSVLMFTYDGDWSTGSLTYQLARGQFMQTGRNIFTLTCLGAESADGALWQREVMCYEIPWEDKNLTLLDDGRSMVCTVGNVCQKIALADGALLAGGELQSSIVTAAPFLEDRIHVVLEDGSVGQFNYDTELGGVSREFQSGLRLACITVDGEGNLRYLTCRDGGDKVLVYGGMPADAGWQAFAGGDLCENMTDKRLLGRGLVTVGRGGGVQWWDLDTGALRWSADVDAETDTPGSLYAIAGLDEAANRLVLARPGSYSTPARLFLLDAGSGAWQALDLPSGGAAGADAIATDVRLAGGRVLYGVNEPQADGGTAAQLYRLDPDTGAAEVWPLWTDGGAVCGLWAAPDGARALAAAADGRCAVLDLESGAVTQMNAALPAADPAGEAGAARAAAWNGDGTRLAVAGGGQLCLWEPDGGEEVTVPFGERTVLDLCFGPDGRLYVLCTDGMLFACAPDGRLAGSVACAQYPLDDEVPVVEWQFLPGGDLAVTDGAILTMVDTAAMTARFTAWECLGCDAAGGRVLSYHRHGQEGRQPGACPRYTLQQLLERGRALAGGITLSEAQRAAYGLE